MRTETERKVIPPEPEPTVVETTWYCCDDCDFRSEDKEPVRLHHGEKHAAKRKLIVGGLAGHEEETGLKLYWFDTEDDANAFLEAECQHFYRSDGVSWREPGWYVREYDRRPCPKGCCRDDYLGLVHIESRLASLRADACSTMARHAEIRKAIKAA